MTSLISKGLESKNAKSKDPVSLREITEVQLVTIGQRNWVCIQETPRGSINEFTNNLFLYGNIVQNGKKIILL